MPLVITLTVATAGIAAWVWSQRRDDDEDAEHEPDLDYENADYGDNPAYGAADDAQYPPPPGPLNSEDQAPPPQQGNVDPSWGTRMSGALRRTPSPQQLFDSTGRTVVAGVAAAGAAVGKALSSIREEDKTYRDGNPWSEEADAKDVVPSSSGKKRKTVAIVVSTPTDLSGMEDDGYHEHAVSQSAPASGE